MSSLRNKIYYLVKPLLSRRFQVFIRRVHLRLVAHRYSAVWPINADSGTVPMGWPGWPEGKQFAFVLTHDVEKEKGNSRVKKLANIEIERGFRSSYNFVARGYKIDTVLFEFLKDRGFEIGVHGVYHDGKMFDSYEIFQERARIINQCLADWGAVGFRAPSMQRNLDWIGELNIEYDASTFDTDPFEPQPDGVGSIFPFWVNGKCGKDGYVELPYTVPQDFTPFILMRVNSTDLWKKKIDWIVQRGGMVLWNTHPDYMSFEGNKPGLEEYPVKFYTELLDYISDKHAGQFWHALPREVANFVRSLEENNGMKKGQSETPQGVQSSPSSVSPMSPD